MQKDYILKIIEQFTEAIGAIISRKKAKKFNEAKELIHKTAKHLLRIDIDLLLLYNPDQILDHFIDFSHRLETERCILSADLLLELALIEEASIQPEIALRLKELCLQLYIAALPKEISFQTPEYFEKVAILTKELQSYPLSEKALINIDSYRKLYCKFSKCSETIRTN